MDLLDTCVTVLLTTAGACQAAAGDNQTPLSKPSTQMPQASLTRPAPRQVEPDAAAPVRLTPLAGYPWLTTMSETPTGKDVVTPPMGATEPRPIVVAIHGAGDRPDWACGGWRIGVESYPFVVCPVGQPMGHNRYAWTNTRAIATAVERALNALHERFDAYCFAGPMIYAGFSQGATLAAAYLIENASRFPVAVLAEGGYDFIGQAWFAQKYYQAGGRRVLLLCGTPSCMVAAQRARRTLEQAGLSAMIAGDTKAGHNLNGAMQRVLREHWQQLVAGVSGWESFGAHRWAT